MTDKLNELTIEKAKLSLELENVNILINQERGKMPRTQAEYNKIIKKARALEYENQKLKSENLRLRENFQRWRESILQESENKK